MKDNFKAKYSTSIILSHMLSEQKAHIEYVSINGDIINLIDGINNELQFAAAQATTTQTGLR